MSISALPTKTKPGSDTSLPIALVTLFGLIVLFFWLKSPLHTEQALDRLSSFIEINELVLNTIVGSILFNILWISASVKKRFKIGGQGASSSQNPTTLQSFKKYSVIFIASSAASIALALFFLELKRIDLLPFNWQVSSSNWTILATTMLSISFIGTFQIGERVVKFLANFATFPFSLKNKLPKLQPVEDGIVLGAIREEQNPLHQEKRNIPEWVYMGVKALTGNVFISGAIGSGKSQVLLQFLKQIITRFKQTPAILAIDPKRTFVRELKNIVENSSSADKLLWVSLDGDVKFNPIWQTEMLRKSMFTTIANSLRLASANFLGSSGDNRFWEQSSFNLLKNSLIFCAAKYEYFTFKELYQALVQARDEGLAGDLVDYLGSKEWNDEERANIEMAIDYFKDEFSQMDQKIRTSILATATSFLNEFLEYRVSRILSPKKEEITLTRMKDAIKEGKIICLYIENDALARSIGTLFKLLFQEAVLERVTDSDHQSARYAVMVMDEYQDVATSGGGAGLGDDRYLAKGREAKAITIAATQSLSSLENAIRSEPATREILQNFRTRIFGNTTDPKTIRLFQEPHGTVDRERKSHSFSESAQNAQADIFFGGVGSNRGSTSEGTSTHYSPEYPVTGREFSRLRAFEAFAQIFDGLETRFEKLFLKPYFLKELRTPHVQIMEEMRKAAMIPGVLSLLIALAVGGMNVHSACASILFPNVCSVIKASHSADCMNMQVSACMCGFPVPHPCAQISYYVPQTFIEAWPEPGTTFFSMHPAVVQLKLASAGMKLPFGVEDDQGNFTFHAHSIAVPLAGITFGPLACGGGRFEKPCFDLLSEDLGSTWTTGTADLLQPQFLAWQLAPKVCLLKGAVQGVTGGTTPSIGPDAGGCSFPLKLPKYPPSAREACNGWGMFLPRSGVYQGATRSAAALMVASRLKSIGTEVMHSIPGSADEKWQMLYPQSSSCFKEGENVGFLETIKGVREEQRLFGKPNGYMFVVWKKVSCCQEIPYAAATEIAILAMKVACEVVPSGGI